ncbi:MAG: TRAP transporter small permease [Brevinema sp.]
MKTIFRVLDKYFEEVCCAIMLGYIVVSVNIEIVARYIFLSPTSFTDEIARILMVSIVFLGTALAIKQNRHVIIDILPQFPPKRILILDLISNLIFIIFCIIYTIVSIKAIEFHKMFSTITEGIGIPYWLALSILPLSFSLSIFRLIQKMQCSVKIYKQTLGG